MKQSLSGDMGYLVYVPTFVSTRDSFTHNPEGYGMFKLHNHVRNQALLNNKYHSGKMLSFRPPVSSMKLTLGQISFPVNKTWVDGVFTLNGALVQHPFLWKRDDCQPLQCTEGAPSNAPYYGSSSSPGGVVREEEENPPDSKKQKRNT